MLPKTSGALVIDSSRIGRAIAVALGLLILPVLCGAQGPENTPVHPENPILHTHPAVARVRYGSLPSWNRGAGSGLLKGFGGMLGVEWKKDSVHQRLGGNVRLMINATSLGDPVTRVIARGEEKGRGIPARYTRVSIGLEEPQDLIADFKQAIERCG